MTGAIIIVILAISGPRLLLQIIRERRKKRDLEALLAKKRTPSAFGNGHYDQEPLIVPMSARTRETRLK